jgi:hypothetical protein
VVLPYRYIYTYVYKKVFIYEFRKMLM